MIAHASGLAVSDAASSTTNTYTCHRDPLWFSIATSESAPHTMATALSRCFDMLSPSHPMMGFSTSELSDSSPSISAAMRVASSSGRLGPVRNHTMIGTNNHCIPECTVFLRPTASTSSQ